MLTHIVFSKTSCKSRSFYQHHRLLTSADVSDKSLQIRILRFPYAFYFLFVQEFLTLCAWQLKWCWCVELKKNWTIVVFSGTFSSYIVMAVVHCTHVDWSTIIFYLYNIWIQQSFIHKVKHCSDHGDIMDIRACYPPVHSLYEFTKWFVILLEVLPAGYPRFIQLIWPGDGLCLLDTFCFQIVRRNNIMRPRPTAPRSIIYST